MNVIPALLCLAAAGQDADNPADAVKPLLRGKLGQDPSEADPFVEKTTGLKFGKEVAGWTRGKFKGYDDPTLGISVNYKPKGDAGSWASLDVYVYDLGRKDIPDGIGGDVIKKQFEQAKRDLLILQKRGSYYSVKNLQEIETPLGLAKGPKAFQAEFEIVNKEGEPPRLSRLYLTGYKGQYLKVRCTYIQEHKKECEEAISKLLRALAAMMTP